MVLNRRRLLTSSATAVLGAGVAASTPVSAVEVADRRTNRWKLAFDENFTGTEVDTTKWNIRDSEPFLAGVPRTWASVPGSTSALDSAKCVNVKDGKAIFHIERLPQPLTVYGHERHFKGGYLDSRGKFAAEYFRVETRMKLPAGPKSHGNHACLWFRPENVETYNPDETVPSLEIDLNEYYGVNYQGKENNLDITQRAQATVHFDQTGKNKTNNPDVYGPGWPSTTNNDLQNDWHIWTLEVTPDKGIVITFDRKEVILHVPANDPRLLRAKKPGTKLHMRLNFEAGTKYWGEVTDYNDLSGTMEVDYIRAWEYMQ